MRIYLAVVLGDLDGEELLPADVGCQAGEGLSPRSSDTDQHQVTPLQAQHSMDPRHVADGVLCRVVVSVVVVVLVLVLALV